MKLRVALLVAAMGFSLAGCAGEPSVRGKPVPTAFFVFFDQGTANPTKDSEAVFAEASAYLKQYDNTSVRIVGHVSADETAPGLDQDRASRTAEELVKRGAQPARMQLLGVGTKEKISGTGGVDDPSVDRRVELLFNAM